MSSYSPLPRLLSGHEGREEDGKNERQSLVRSRSHHPTAGSKLRMSNALGKHITHAARSLVPPRCAKGGDRDTWAHIPGLEMMYWMLQLI